MQPVAPFKVSEYAEQESEDEESNAYPENIIVYSQSIVWHCPGL
jgi:hypothetical protein